MLWGEIKLLALDFDGVMTDNTVQVSSLGGESVVCDRSDGLGIQMVQDLGVHVVVLTSEESRVVEQRCWKLQIPCFREDKALTLRTQQQLLLGGLSKQNLKLKTAYLGNDVNDLEVMRHAGIPCCVQDAHQELWPVSKYRTTAMGGHGAVREICDLIIAGKRGAKL